MLSGIKKFFGKPDAATPAIAPQLAVAQLLMEMARADFAADAAEITTLRALLAKSYALDDVALDQLLAEAAARSARSISLYDTVSAINDQVTPEQKKELLAMLWRVAYADGALDKYEEGLLRQLADLLFVSHADFIREKLAVIGEQGV